ncbi:MAG TPA: hypothetical protein VNT75_21560 [Symbiobacteriaceae bacterium]|nr:hypothetical protein [Symbiobacteriaceae bacterium]
MKLITIGDAARLLSVDPQTLRRKETSDGQCVELYGHRIRVYRVGGLFGGQRRFDEDEIWRVLAKMRRAK